MSECVECVDTVRITLVSVVCRPYVVGDAHTHSVRSARRLVGHTLANALRGASWFAALSRTTRAFASWTRGQA